MSFFDLEIDRKDDDSIKVRQMHYIKKILECFDMSKYRTILTLIIKKNDTKESSLNTEFPHRQRVGALMHLMRGTKPDIA